MVRARSLVIIAMAAGFLLSGYLAVREGQVRRVEALAAAGRYREIVLTVSCRLGCPARIRLALAVATDRLASKAPQDARTILIDQSLTDLNLLAASAATRAAALLEEVYALSLTPGRDTALLETFRQSYAAEPFNREAAVWRVAFAAAHWPQLDDATRRAALQEADLADGIDAETARSVAAAMLDSPMAVSFLLRNAASQR